METQDTEIVMTRSVQVRQVFHDEHKLCVEDQSDEHGLVCCTCLEPSPDLLLGECACLVCGQCWALQGAAMYCLNCKTNVNYIQMKEVFEFPAKGQMGKLFLTKEFLRSTIVSFSEFVKKQSKLQLSALKIFDKQQAAWKNKINLEKKEFQKRRKEMEELEEIITAKTESIKALEEGIRRLTPVKPQALASPRSLSFTQDDLVKEFEIESQLKPLQMLPRQLVGSEEQIQDKNIIMNSTKKSKSMLLHPTLPGVLNIPTLSLTQSSSLCTETDISSTGSSQSRHRISEGEDGSATTNNSYHYPRTTWAVPAQPTSPPGIYDKYRVLRNRKAGKLSCTALNVVQTRGGQDCGIEGRSWKDEKREEELRTSEVSRISPPGHCQSYTEQQVDRPKKRKWVLASKARQGKDPR